MEQLGTLKQYPQVMKVVSFYSLIGTVQCMIISLAIERDLNAWKLKLDTELLLIILTVRELMFFTFFCCVFLVVYANCSYNPITVTGNFWWSDSESCPGMVHAVEGSSLCSHVQAIRDYLCKLFRHYLLWK